MKRLLLTLAGLVPLLALAGCCCDGCNWCCCNPCGTACAPACAAPATACCAPYGAPATAAVPVESLPTY